jgi:hypothetical protein
MARLWKYILGDSHTMAELGELRDAKNRTLQFDNNKTGSAACNYQIDRPLAELISPWETCLIARRDDTDQTYWSGPITTKVSDASSGVINISAIGWFDLLTELLVPAKTVFTNKDAGFIASALLDMARVKDPTMPITIGTVETTQLRTITYELDQPIGAAIQQLGDLESGYDWYVDPVTRKLNIVARRGQDKPDCEWTFIHDPVRNIFTGNLKNVIETVDGTTVCNDMTPRGKFNSGFAADTDSKARFFVHQEAPSMTDIGDNDILNAFANEEMVYRGFPRVTYKIFPKTPEEPGVPSFPDDFDIGDTCRLTASRGFIKPTRLPIRTFGVSLSIADNGVATVNNIDNYSS